MGSRLHRTWFWIRGILILLLMTLLALSFLPGLRVRYALPLVASQSEEVKYHLTEWLYLGNAVYTTAGFHALIDLLDHPDGEVRGLASQWIGQIALCNTPPIDAAHRQRLRATIEDPDTRIAANGICALTYMHDRDIRERLIARSRTTSSRPILSSICQFIANLAPEEMDAFADRLLRSGLQEPMQIAWRGYSCCPSETGFKALLRHAMANDTPWDPVIVNTLHQALRILMESKDHSPLFINEAHSQRLLLEALNDQSCSLDKRTWLAQFIPDQRIIYHWCQAALQNTQDHWQEAELVLRALCCLEKKWHFNPGAWSTANSPSQWPAKHTSPDATVPDLNPSPALPGLLAAIKTAIIHADQGTAGAAILTLAKEHQEPLTGDERDFVVRIVEGLESGDPYFGF